MAEMVKLSPSYKDYLWGGDHLIKSYGKDPSYEILAESWELSCHKDGPSYIESGPLKGKTLSEYISTKGFSILGTKCEQYSDFPLLVKLIDAKQDLSIQVHPNDEYALKYENQYGKTEMWYVLEAQEGASIYYGTKDTVTPEAFKEAVLSNRVLELLNKVPVKAGDAILVEAGTIHAIGAGVMICEVQQNSNVTYRVFDFNRVGSNGERRELHLEKALEVSNLRPIVTSFSDHNLIIENKETSYDQLIKHTMFDVKRLSVNGNVEIGVDNSSFKAFVCIVGKVDFENKNEKLSLNKGETLFVEAGRDILSINGNATLIEISL